MNNIAKGIIFSNINTIIKYKIIPFYSINI